MNTETKKKIRITDTTLRDAHQSLWATRLRTDDILQIAETIDGAGYYSLECWGGATFDVCMRFLRENPWERLRQIKAVCKKTPLQMLLRGQNILGYKHYPDDVVDRFVALACENGMDIFRVFDALNDPRNLEQAIRSVKKYGGHAQGTICYTTSPVHTVEAYVKLAQEQVAMGIDSLAIKDMAGILTPGAARALVGALVRACPDLPIQEARVPPHGGRRRGGRGLPGHGDLHDELVLQPAALRVDGRDPGERGLRHGARPREARGDQRLFQVRQGEAPAGEFA